MATTLSVNRIQAAVGWSLTDSHNFGDSSNSGTFQFLKTLAQGTGAGFANKIYVAEDDTGISASGTLTINLQSVTDVYGNALSFTKVKVVYIENAAATSTTSLVVGNAGSNAWSGTSALLYDATGQLLLSAGSAFIAARTDATGWVVDATHKNILITNLDGSNAAPYRFLVAGE